MVGRGVLLSFGLFGLAMIPGTSEIVTGQTMEQPVIRLAEITVEAAQLSTYTKALKEEIAASIRVEPGVLKLYAVAVKDHPTEIRIFEMYRDHAAYEAHLQSPHFKKYKAETQGMVASLKLTEADAVLLGEK